MNLQLLEQSALARRLYCGEPYKYDFHDPRHRLIYDYLSYLQKQLFKPSAEQLIGYLAEYGVLDKAGGLAYLKAIFQSGGAA
jgi:replicative DNA helicase